MSRVKVQWPRTQAEHAALRRSLESFDTIDLVSDEMRAIIIECFPDLISKLPPPKPRARPARKRRVRAKQT